VLAHGRDWTSSFRFTTRLERPVDLGKTARPRVIRGRTAPSTCTRNEKVGRSEIRAGASGNERLMRVHKEGRTGVLIFEWQGPLAEDTWSLFRPPFHAVAGLAEFGR